MNFSPISESSFIASGINTVLDTSGAEVGDDTQIGFNITYMLNKQWGVKVFRTYIFKYEFTGISSLRGVPIGVSEHLPPTISED